MNSSSVLDFTTETRTQNTERERLVYFVRKWGDVNTDGILDSACQIYNDSAIDGVIGYRIESNNAVVFGDPVCSNQDKPALAHSFQNFCSQKNLGVIYTIVSEEFALWASQNLNAALIEFGETFVLNPMSNPINHTGSKAVLVRKKVKHARQEGAIVQEYNGHDFSIEQQIEDLAREWQKGRHGPQIYLAQITLFNDRMGKRWFYATCKDKIVGILVLNKLEARNGWLLNNVMITKDAPHGISEFLIISTLQILEQENCERVVVGPVPGKELGKISGLNSIATKITQWAYSAARKIFHLRGHEVFWEKFEPAVHSSYLLFPNKNLTISSVKALLKAFNVKLSKQ